MSLSNATRITSLDTSFTGNLITAAIAALIAYDYVLTLQREARLFWTRKINAASILFFVNRYIAVVYYVGLAYYRGLTLPYPACKIHDDIDIGTRYLEYLPWAVFSALRVYALSGKNWWLTSFTFFWAVLVFPLNYYGDFHHRSIMVNPVLGCTSNATTPTSLSEIGSSSPSHFLSSLGTIFIRGGQIIADLVVIGVTWKATYDARDEGSMPSLMGVMFRNGTQYFIVLLVLNVLHIIFAFLPNTFLHTPLTNTSYVPRFSEPLTAILVSHFMLDLHETHRALSHQDLGPSTIQIMSVNIGQPYSKALEIADMEEYSVALNLTLSHTDPENRSGETDSLPSKSTNGHSDVV